MQSNLSKGVIILNLICKMSQHLRMRGLTLCQIFDGLLEDIEGISEGKEVVEIEG